MASYSAISVGLRIFVLLLIVLVLIFGGLIWFDFLGAIDVKGIFAPIYQLFGLQVETPIEGMDSVVLLERQRLEKDMERVTLLQEELDKREQDLTSKEAEMTAKIDEMQERENNIEQRENSFNQGTKAFDNRREALEQISNNYISMPPDKAVAIMENMSNQEIIEILLVTEELAAREGEASMVSYWLSLMKPERAATLQRMLAKNAES